MWNKDDIVKAGKYLRDSRAVSYFEGTTAGKYFMRLSPGWRLGAGFGAALMGLALARSVKRAIYSPENYPPPPAYGGTYGKIEGMKARYGVSDFGSRTHLDRTVNRGILPGRHVDHFMRRFR